MMEICKPKRVPSYQQFFDGLRKLEQVLSAPQRQLLIEQFRSPSHAAFARELASRCGFQHWGVVNIHYANASKLFCRTIKFEPGLRDDCEKSRWWSVWSWGLDYGRGRFEWHMHASLVKAITELGWQRDAYNVYENEVDAVDEQIFEGRLMRITVNAYERNPRARDLCLLANGCKCRVCDFDFEKRYGEIGRDYIHVHHVDPIAQSTIAHRVDPQKDLVPVCPNCHAMLHKRNPPFTTDELRLALR